MLLVALVIHVVVGANVESVKLIQLKAELYKVKNKL